MLGQDEEEFLDSEVAWGPAGELERLTVGDRGLPVATGDDCESCLWEESTFQRQFCALKQ